MDGEDIQKLPGMRGGGVHMIDLMIWLTKSCQLQ